MAQKAIFLDRDDTLIDDPGYIREPEQIKLLPGAAEAIVQFKKMGYLLIILTNQSAIARGLLTEEKLASIHQRLKSMLAAEGAFIDRIYYCPYHPDGTVEGYNIESPLRKPSPGMFHLAAKELDIDLSRSWMIGDRYRDIEAGKAAGCHTILVDAPGKIREQKSTDPLPDRKAVNLREAVNIIRMYEFRQKAQAAKKITPPDPQKISAEIPEPSAPEEEITPPVIEAIEIPTPAAIAEEVQATSVCHSREGGNPAIETPAGVNGSPPAQPTLAETEPIKLHTAKALPKIDAASPDDHTHPDKTHHLLQEILKQLASSSRNEFTEDFSVHKLLAGMAQVFALGCLVFSLWFLLSPEVGYERVQLLIGYAIALQLLVISLLLMHRRE